MAFTIDPEYELIFGHLAPSVRRAIERLTVQGDKLSPGEKVRVAAALKKIAGSLEVQAKSEIGLQQAGDTATDVGVLFHLVAKSEQPVIKPAMAATLLPIKKYPKAWGISKTGGSITTTIGPLVDE